MTEDELKKLMEKQQQNKTLDEKEIDKIMEEKQLDREQAGRIYQQRKERKYVEEQHNKPKKQEPASIKEQDIKPENIILEPVLNNDTPKWLKIKQITKAPEGKHNIRLAAQGELEPETETVFEIVDPNQWRCKKCKNIMQSKNEPTECLKDLGGCDRKTTFERVTDDINIKRWKLPRWKDIPRDDISMPLVYQDLVSIVKRCIIFPEDIHYDIFALWTIASYKRESFDSIGFLMFLGLWESGKTRGFDLLRELGYQMIHTTGVTFPCMCRYTDKYQAGILIDEIDNKLHKGTEDGRRYMDFLKPSYRRGSVYATADLQNQDETREYSNYGFKAFAGEKGGGDIAFLSRCHTFKMEQAYPEIPELKYIQEELDEMQNVLLNYRYKFNDPEPLPLDFPLKGRAREIFSFLIQTAKHIGIEHDHIVQYITEMKQDRIDDMQQTDDYMVLKAIKQIQEITADSNLTTLDLGEISDSPEHASYSDIAQECGWDPETEEGRKKRQRIGYILKKFGLRARRHGIGNVLLLNHKKNVQRLKNLYKRYFIN